MALVTKPSTKHPLGPPRHWKAPLTRAWWLWLLGSLAIYGIVLLLYFGLHKNSFDIGASDPLLFTFGIVAFLLVLGAASFSLRRRFVRGLPGKAQVWLWMHTWIGFIALMVAFVHENYDHILHDQAFNVVKCAADSHFGRVTLYGLILLVMSGGVGRLLDTWKARTIARDASTNGVGIVQALNEHILELEYGIERLSAGKSEQFKQYCMQAIESTSAIPGPIPALAPHEQSDFQHAYQTLTYRSNLVRSLHTQQSARLFMRIWRYIHITLACLVLLILLYHVGMETLSYGLHIISTQVNACS